MVNLHCGADLCTANHFLGLFCLWCMFVYMCVVVLVHIHICCFGSAQEPALGLEPPERLMGKDPISTNRVCLGFFFFLEEMWQIQTFLKSASESPIPHNSVYCS